MTVHNRRAESSGLAYLTACTERSMHRRICLMPSEIDSA